jgi:hypothetical protein
MNTDNKGFAPDTTPKPRVYLERIGEKEWELQEASLDVFEQINLWPENPRLQTHLPNGTIASEADLEAALQQTGGYGNLRTSIQELGQMEPVYAWRADEDSKYVVFEGATRVTILRELTRRGGAKAEKYRRAKVKILPPHFGLMERAILLARIHVRGTGVRAWGRYIEAKFIHDNVTGPNGSKGLMTVTEMANHMEKSVSWVQRLRDAYQFAQKFIEVVDIQEGEQIAADQFSTLEEISKAPTIGSWLRDYDNPVHDELRADVFDMVRNKVFKEYRDARFLKQFYEDPEKWALLKTGEANIASRLAAEVKNNGSSLKAKIAGMEASVERALQNDEHGLGEEDVAALQNTISRINEVVHQGVGKFRIELKQVCKVLENASLGDIKTLQPSDHAELTQAMDYFNMLVERYKKASA